MTVVIFGGELTADRAERAVDYAEAMHAAELPLMLEQGGSPLGLEPEMAAHARHLAGELARGTIDAVGRSWLTYIVGLYEREEAACLAVGLDYRASYRAMVAASG